MARGNGTDSAGAEGATATAEAPTTELTPEEQAKLEAKREARKARRAQRSYVLVPMPSNMKAVFEDEAKTAEKPLGIYVRDFLAGQRGIEIPVSVTTRRQKYASDEEREAAKKARRESRSNTMKGLMATFNLLTKSGISAEQATAVAAAALTSGRPIEDILKEQGIALPASA